MPKNGSMKSNFQTKIIRTLDANIKSLNSSKFNESKCCLAFKKIILYLKKKIILSTVYGHQNGFIILFILGNLEPLLPVEIMLVIARHCS